MTASLREAKGDAKGWFYAESGAGGVTVLVITSTSKVSKLSMTALENNLYL